jgi:hypothetical protein
MNRSLFSIVCGASTILVGMSAYASHWNAANDPNLFNTASHPTNYTTNLNALPLSGAVDSAKTPWADSYWPKNRGGAAYPWHKFSREDARQNLTTAEAAELFMNYKLPSKKDILKMSQAELEDLSPTVKFEIAKGDFGYPITKSYLNRGFFRHLGIGGASASMSNSKDAAYWEGYCNAWSAVSLHYSEPKPVTITVTIKGHAVQIPFGSGDVKALMVASYAEQLGDNPQIGNRCEKRFSFPATKHFQGKEMFTQYPNTDGLMMTDFVAYLKQFQENASRIGYKDPNGPNPTDPNFIAQMQADAESPECSDTNAGAFHIVMTNQLGIMKEGFVIDRTRDLEIWNQPSFKYVSTVLGTGLPTAKSAPGTVSTVRMKSTLYYADDTDYGWAYWNPTLTNLFSTDSAFMDEYNAYQRVLVRQGDQEKPLTFPNGVIDRQHYVYDLELDRDGKIIGGEWETFDRPDFLWLPKRFNFINEYEALNSLHIYQPISVPSGAVLNFGLDD